MKDSNESVNSLSISNPESRKGQQKKKKTTNLQPIHNVRHLRLFHHTAHRNPRNIIQRTNSGGPPPRRDLDGLVEVLPLDVVVAKAVLARGDESRDARRDLLDEGCVRGGLVGPDEDRLRREERGDGVETSCAHRFSGF